MSDDRRKALASAVIVLVIALHAVPLVVSAERGTLWPFMVYAMYKHSRPTGPVEVNQRRILAVTASGARDTVTPDLLGGGNDGQGVTDGFCEAAPAFLERREIEGVCHGRSPRGVSSPLLDTIRSGR